jgi:hypothetical protein
MDSESKREAMNMSQHTPGKWEWQPNDGQFIVDAHGNIVAEIPCTKGNPADGPLIAAAPDLLAALEEAAQFYQDVWEVDAKQTSEHAAVTKWRSVCRKARGEEAVLRRVEEGADGSR